MKFRFPLYAQIITMFVINIALLAGVRLLLAGNHFNIGWESVIYAPVGERIRTIGFVIHQQMRALPRNQWNNVLNEFGNYYGVKLYVFDSHAREIAGEKITLPAQVTAKLTLPRTFPFPADFPRHPVALAKMPWFSHFGQLPRPPFPPCYFIQTSSPDRFWIATFLPLPEVQGPGTLLAVTSNLWQTRLVENYGYLFVFVLGVFCFSFVIWWPFVYGITRALGKLTSATEQIAEGKFDKPITISRTDEIGRLAIAINSMSNRLNGYLSGQKRFLGDIAHELSSPVARLQVALAILETEKTPQQTSTIEDIREDLEQMSLLINELLAYSKASLAGKATELVQLDLETVLRAAIARTCPNNSVELNIQPGLTCLGDRLLLDRAFGNILRNAIAYASEYGPIEVVAYRSSKETVVLFNDQGPGVPEEAIELLGQPFYRPEPSRSRSFGGVGLGLAIVKTCIETCNGTVTISNRQSGGLQVAVHLVACDNSHVPVNPL